MASQDAAAKSRIITHMNNDHHDSVIRYLQHFGKLSASTAYDGRMTDIDLHGFTLTCQGKTYRVPFEPPMKSLTEARERVVAIDKDARKALGQHDVTVKNFVPPHGPGAVAAVITLAVLVAFSQRWWFAPGELAEQFIGAKWAATCFKYQPHLFWGLLGTHALETIIFSQNKLKKHSVNPRTSAYWLWIVSNMIEGVGCLQRFNRVVKKIEEKQKH